MRIPFGQFRVRTLLILVAVSALLLGSAITAVRRLETDHAVFLRREAAAYDQAGREWRRSAADAARRGDLSHAAEWAKRAEANAQGATDTRHLLAESEAMIHGRSFRDDDGKAGVH